MGDGLGKKISDKSHYVSSVSSELKLAHRGRNAVWLECTPDLEPARDRQTQLATTSLPGEYFVFDQSRQRIVVSVVRLGSDLVQ
jgi:hypothetical protein